MRPKAEDQEKSNEQIDPVHQTRMAFIWRELDLIDGFREFLRKELEDLYGEFSLKTYKELFEELDPIWTLYGGT
mgnify:CR=1 FL=1